MQPSDEYLMLLFKGGDQSAFNVLVQRWEKPLLNLCYRFLQDIEKAKDIRQEVFLRIYKAAKRYKPSAKFSTWLYRIALNRCLDELRNEKRRNEIALETSYQDNNGKRWLLKEMLVDKSALPDEIAERNEIAQIVKQAIALLPDEQRAVVIMRHYERLKFKEIAEIMGCPESTVKSRMYYGMEHLRRLLACLQTKG
jgi:RNA polymerase sigma-70 factor (ECF subfamily)